MTVVLHNQAVNSGCWPNLDQEPSCQDIKPKVKSAGPLAESRPINHRHINRPEGLPFAPINSQLNDDNIGASKEEEEGGRGQSHQFSYQISIGVDAGLLCL